MIEAGIKFIFEKTNSSKESSATTGCGANSATTGDRANSEVNGTNSIDGALGVNSKVKGNLSCFIICAEWEQDKNYNWIPKNVKSIKVDGKKIKANIWYKVENNKWVECE